MRTITIVILSLLLSACGGGDPETYPIPGTAQRAEVDPHNPQCPRLIDIINAAGVHELVCDNYIAVGASGG